MNEWIFDVTAETFGTAVVERSHEVPVLVDFWADWCEPCKNLMPILQSVVEAAAGAVLLAKVDTDKEQAMAMQMGIQSLPTVALVKGGQIVDSFTGLKSETELKEWLATYVSFEPVTPQHVANQDIQELIDVGDLDTALAQLSTLASDQVFSQLIQVYLLKGDLQAAQKVYDGLSEFVQNSAAGIRAKGLINLARIEIKDRLELQQLQSLLQSGQYEVALEQLLDLLAQPGDKSEIKQLLIVAFDLLEDPEAVAGYRRRMSRLLF